DSVLTINSKILKDSLNCVINSSATSDSRPEISSIYFKINPDQIKFIATDSFRLAHKTIFVSSDNFKEKIKIDFEKSGKFILPLRTAGELLRILGDQNDNVKIIIDDNQILFDFNNTHLISRLVTGNYPDYEAIIPTSSETRCYLSKRDLEESIRLSGCFSSKLNDVTLKTNSLKSQIEVFSLHSEYGNHNSKINSEIKGKDVSVVFNWRYFLDGLKNIEDDEIVLEFNGDLKPAVIKSAKNADFFYILMPIRNT
ncbi:MAG: DNA polymerase III subunit beta, partial [Patescibacteria group bacterium]